MDTIDALRLFVAIAETGSLSAAARREAVATSTVTVALQQLEERAGGSLITRSTRQLTFTHEGQRFLSDARRLLAHWDESLPFAQGGSMRGPIKIAAPFELGHAELTLIVDRFMDLHPAVEVTLHLADNTVEMAGRDIDVAVRSGPLTDSTLKARLLVRATRVVCAAPAYWERCGMPVQPNELSQHNCLAHPRPGATFAAWPFVVEGKPVSIHIRGDRGANDSAILKHWAIAGRGVLRRSDWGIRRELSSGKLVTALDAFAAGDANLYAVTTPGVSSHRLNTFIDFLARELLVA